MRALINQIIQQNVFPEQLETLVLVGCGRIPDLPVAHRNLAERFIYMEPNPRFAEMNAQAVSSLENSVFLDQAWATDSGVAEFFQFNLPQFDGLLSLEQLGSKAGNLKQIASRKISTVSATGFLDAQRLNSGTGPVAIVADVGELVLQLLNQDLPILAGIRQLVISLPRNLALPDSLHGWTPSLHAAADFTGQQLVCLVPPPQTAVHADESLLLENTALKQEIQVLKARISELESRLESANQEPSPDYAIQLKQSEERNRMINSELLKGFAQIDLLKELMLKDNLP